MPMEDLDDHPGAIQDRRRGGSLNVAELARGEIVVDDDDGGAWLAVGRGGFSWPGEAVSAAAFFLPGGPLETTPVPPVHPASSASLPWPRSVIVPTPVRFCVTSPTTSKPSVSQRRLSSVSDDR